MTEEALRLLLYMLPVAQDWPDPLDELLVALEQAAEAHPRDRPLAYAIHCAHQLSSAGRGLPPLIDGIRWRQLVRTDAYTATWDGLRAEDGTRHRLRVMRAEHARDPVLRRTLDRENRALSGVVAGIRPLTEWPGLTAPLPGPPLQGAEDGPTVQLPLLARVLGTALGELQRWEEAGLGLPPLGRSDLRDTATGVKIVCLTAGPPAGADAIRAVASRVHAWAGDADANALTELLQGLVSMPHARAIDAMQAFREALATELAGHRHAILSSWHHTVHQSRERRLANAIGRLFDSVPHPRGRGAVGIDLEGRTTLVEGRPTGLFWGPLGALEDVWTPEAGLQAQTARRLLRGRAAAPPNPRLHQEVGGDDGFTEACCRWVSASLRLRTLNLLLSTETDQPWEIAL